MLTGFVILAILFWATPDISAPKRIWFAYMVVVPLTAINTLDNIATQDWLF